MKRILMIMVLIFISWRAAVFIVNKAGSGNALSVTEASAIKATLQDSVKKRPADSTTGKSRDTVAKNNFTSSAAGLDTAGARGRQIVDFAKTLIGVPYLYGSADPAKGFDCSGFITHVFNHFNITVPRSSIDFTHEGREISTAEARPGDLILFAGTDSTERFVGHMGIVTDNIKDLNFIHSTSGKMFGVTITPLNDYYKKRYVKTIRILL